MSRLKVACAVVSSMVMAAAALGAAPTKEDFQGSRTLTLQVKQYDGKSTSGLEWKLIGGAPGSAPVELGTGAIDPQGNGKIENIADTPMTDNRIMYLEILSGDSELVGMKVPSSEETSVPLAITLPPGAGDQAPDVTLIDAFTSAPVKLSDFRGQVVFLDFWATWCPPCQEPMANNQKIMAENGDRWKGKAIILGASIDDSTSEVVKHVKSKGWTAVRHLWCPPDAQGSTFKSPAGRAFGIKGVPTTLLIDKTGKIVWRGHPMEIDDELVKRIDGMI